MGAGLRVDAASRTHIGLVCRRNDDSFYQGQYLYAVADGLGGHVAGDIASATALDAVKPYDCPTPEADLANSLGQAINDANEAIRRTIRTKPALAGMGTTLVALLRSGNTAVLANIGDSRAYLVRQIGAHRTAMVRISEDHTYRHLVSGAAQVPNLPEKLARFLDGRSDGRSPDLTALPLRGGDRILLCSDGLSTEVPHDALGAALRSAQSPQLVADNLVALALDGGGQDNVTVIVIDIADPEGF